MIVRGAKINDSKTKVLCRGTEKECLAWIRTQDLPSYDALDILNDDGTMHWKLVRFGKPSHQY